MSKNHKHLDAKGKGEYKYDYRNDILLFKIKDRDYLKSINFENITIDIDKEGFITGIRIFDASKILRLSKIVLNKIKQFEFNSRAENNVIAIQLNFIAVRRNKLIVEKGQDFIRESIHSNVKDSEALCTIGT